jgi:hypothetical protein
MKLTPALHPHLTRGRNSSPIKIARRPRIAWRAAAMAAKSSTMETFVAERASFVSHPGVFSDQPAAWIVPVRISHDAFGSRLNKTDTVRDDSH